MSAKAKGAGAYEARRRRVGVGPRSTAAILIVKRAREMRRGKSRAAARAGGRVGRGRMRRWKGRGSAAGAREPPGQPEQLARGRWAQQGRIARFRSWFGWVFCTIWATVRQVESSSLWIMLADCVFPRSGTNCLTVVAYSLRSRRQEPPTTQTLEPRAYTHYTFTHRCISELWTAMALISGCYLSA